MDWRVSINCYGWPGQMMPAWQGTIGPDELDQLWPTLGRAHATGKVRDARSAASNC